MVEKKINETVSNQNLLAFLRFFGLGVFYHFPTKVAVSAAFSCSFHSDCSSQSCFSSDPVTDIVFLTCCCFLWLMNLCQE